MHVSFDLDGTLIPNGNEFKTENRNRIAKFFGIEKIRKGTPKLILALQKKGHKVHIYTTSFRKESQIRLTLRYYGIKVHKIVTQTENQKVLKQLHINVSKYPIAFGFEIHIDDLIGVGIEGKKHNFKTIIVDASDVNWIETVLSKINE